MESEIISKLIEHGPVVIILVWVIWRDSKKIVELEKENKELNGYIRESEKEAITFIGNMKNSIDELSKKIH
jgi:predicted Rossmann-fold nucleotide-binding protein